MPTGHKIKVTLENKKHGPLGTHFALLNTMQAHVQTLSLGNNETLVRGIFENKDGTFTAITYSRSKTFKTFAGANRWFLKNTGKLGTQLAK